jgi:hypothetical protein
MQGRLGQAPSRSFGKYGLADLSTLRKEMRPMRVLLIGATGRLGAAVYDALRDRHEVVTASRNGMM